MKIARKISKLACIAPVLLMPLSSLSQAGESYQYAVGGNYDKYKSDDDFKMTTITAAGTYYFAPISYENGPYGEAEFLHRQSGISAGLGNVKIEAPIPVQSGTVNLDANGTTKIIILEYADQTQPVTAGVNYNSFEADDTILGRSIDFNSDELSFKLGYYLTDRSRVSVEYTDSDFESKSAGVSFSKTKAKIYTIAYKNVVDLGGDRYINVKLAGERSDSEDEDNIKYKNNEVSVRGDFYINKAISIGGGFASNNGDDASDEGKTLTVALNGFINPTTTVGIEYEKFSADEENNDDKHTTILFETRF